jgi:hypothetical protein
MVRLGYSPTQILVGWLPSSNPKSHGDDCLVHQVSSSPWAGANDPLNLLAVDSSADRSKGDGDTATWLPTNKAYRCTYVARQVAVKGKYGLWVTLAERDAMIRVFTTCPAMGLPGPGAASTVAVLPRTANSPAPAPAPAPSASSTSSLSSGGPSAKRGPTTYSEASSK